MSEEKKIIVIISCHDIERTKYCCTMILWSRFQAFKSSLCNASGHKSSTLQFTCPKLCRIPQYIIRVLKDVTRVEYINFRFEYILSIQEKKSYASRNKLNYKGNRKYIWQTFVIISYKIFSFYKISYKIFWLKRKFNLSKNMNTNETFIFEFSYKYYTKIFFNIKLDLITNDTLIINNQSFLLNNLEIINSKLFSYGKD